jgi:hypothetical protein
MPGAKITIRKNKEKVILKQGEEIIGTIEVAESNPTVKCDILITAPSSVTILRHKEYRDDNQVNDSKWNSEQYNR